MAIIIRQLSNFAPYETALDGLHDFYCSLL
jgi:hypothetical protein